MSREIKVRVWSDQRKDWLGAGEPLDNYIWYSYDDNKVTMKIPNGYIGTIEQYTGLKDRNGKEIYEGDIVDYAGECTCVIQYEDDGARFIHRDISDDFPFGFNGLGEYNGKLFEVIGNIHENPELLGDEQ